MTYRNCDVPNTYCCLLLLYYDAVWRAEAESKDLCFCENWIPVLIDSVASLLARCAFYSTIPSCCPLLEYQRQKQTCLSVPLPETINHTHRLNRHIHANVSLCMCRHAHSLLLTPVPGSHPSMEAVSISLRRDGCSSVSHTVFSCCFSVIRQRSMEHGCWELRNAPLVVS